MKKTGSQIFVESLKMEGVDTIFCYPGGATLNITDALCNCPEIKQIVVRHEQGGVHAADGYARASGKVGVCLVTSGPGQQIPLQVLPLHIWILFLLWSLPVR